MKNVTYTSAGGVMLRNGHVLVLLGTKTDEVRLPKGHVDRDEMQAQAALREVAQESGSHLRT